MNRNTSSYQRANQAKAFFILGAVVFSLSVLLLTYLVGTQYGRLAAAEKRLAEIQKTQEPRSQKTPAAPTWSVSPEESPIDPDQEPDPESTSETEPEPDAESEPLPESEKNPVTDPNQF